MKVNYRGIGVFVAVWGCMLGLTLQASVAAVIINEVLGDNPSTDAEFIELYNTDITAVDISGWSIELWDSDDGGTFGGADGASPYVIPAATTIPGNGYYLLANALAETDYGITPDLSLPANAIENSSYTMILKDAADNTVETIFVTDGDAGDAPNDAGVAVVPDFTVGPDGDRLPAGFGKQPNGGSSVYLLEFADPSPNATPGAANIPEPGALLLSLWGLCGTLVVALRYRWG